MYLLRSSAFESNKPVICLYKLCLFDLITVLSDIIENHWIIIIGPGICATSNPHCYQPVSQNHVHLKDWHCTTFILGPFLNHCPRNLPHLSPMLDPLLSAFPCLSYSWLLHPHFNSAQHPFAFWGKTVNIEYYRSYLDIQYMIKCISPHTLYIVRFV